MQRTTSPIRTSVGEGLEFLQSLLDDEEIHRGYSAINTARSALSAVILLENGGSFGEHPHVKRFMKGVYNRRPSEPRYTDIWDPEDVLNFLKKWSPAKRISLKQLTLKVVVLILLVTGHRGQVLRALRVNNMEIGANWFKFRITNAELKQGRYGYKPEILQLKKFPVDHRLCVVNYLKVYLERTLPHRGTIQELFMTLKKPYKRVSRDTFSRWVKEVLTQAGIDTGKFKPGSTRAASLSKAGAKGATVDELLKGGGVVKRVYVYQVV